MKRVAVLASGGGSNLQAILDYLASRGDRAAAQVVLVASDQPEAGALARAESAGITALALTREQRTTELSSILARHHIDLVVLAGYLRLVPPDVVAHYRGRILNVHPALLPAFGGPGMYGNRVHEAVVASGASLTGPSVHFVDERYDEGPVIAQTPVPVLPHDSADVVARRVLDAEHQLYPRVIEAVAAGLVRLDSDNRIIYDGSIDFRPLDFGVAHPRVKR
ncbi:MAG TPA: phosphoribosylglycinamide formyltransferase [Gemmatimonadaceae bacterium]